MRLARTIERFASQTIEWQLTPYVDVPRTVYWTKITNEHSCYQPAGCDSSEVFVNHEKNEARLPGRHGKLGFYSEMAGFVSPAGLMTS